VLAGHPRVAHGLSEYPGRLDGAGYRLLLGRGELLAMLDREPGIEAEVFGHSAVLGAGAGSDAVAGAVAAAPEVARLPRVTRRSWRWRQPTGCSPASSASMTGCARSWRPRGWPGR